MADVRLVIHGHFYQPPRENPWTEEVAAEPSAAPFHDWNERITAECYRPNAWARVIDESGRVAGIVNNYAHLSFNIGPTLLSWMERHEPEVYGRIRDADVEGRGAIAQAYNHAILPLASERDIRTQIRWGLADFAHRFGRPAEGMWLPETAVNDVVLRLLAEEGVRFTILAPGQAARVRPLDRAGDEGAWIDVGGGTITTGPPFRWRHPDAGDRDDAGLDIVFYDGPISHDLAFGLAGLSSQEVVRRVIDAGADGTPVVAATDGETFGHHHTFADRALAFAFASEAPARGVRVISVADLVGEMAPMHEVAVRESAWSCAHGVARWRDDCGCTTGAEPGWNQRWRAPLRAALDRLRDFGVEVAERRGPALFRDVWSARDAYIAVLLGATTPGAFVAEHGTGGPDGLDDSGRVAALTLMEAQRHLLLMYTSCGWFFGDLAGLETVQVLRYAARAADLLTELGERPPVDEVLEILARATSNRPDEGDGRDVWHRHVEPARVDADRVAAHVALVGLLQPQPVPPVLAGHEVTVSDEHHRRHGGISVVTGRVTLVHRRTTRRTERVFAAAHFHGLDVQGATRPPDDDPARDARLVGELIDAVERGARVSTILRLVGEGFGPREFGLESALPDAPDQIMHDTAERLVERFSSAIGRLYEDTRPTIDALITAGYPLPPELQAPAAMALAQRFEAEIAAIARRTPPETQSFARARAIVAEARRAGIDGDELATPRAADLLHRCITEAVDLALTDATTGPVDTALGLLRLVRELDIPVDTDPAQERVFAALEVMPADAGLKSLAAALDLAG
jgi:alpha-amylase/alpha-mannosidase (GH57 family)